MQTQILTASSIDELKEQLNTAREASFSPNLAIVFASIVHDLEAVRRIFKEENISTFGASSSGEVANSTVLEESIVAMLFDVPTDSFAVKLFPNTGETSYQTGEIVGQWAKQAFSTPALLLLASGLQTDGEQIVHGVVDKVGYELPLFGGLAGDDKRLKETFIFDANTIHSHGVVGLVFDADKVEMIGTTASGWRGVGTPKIITKSEGNIVYTIDDQPALDVYSKYLNLSDESNVLVNAEHPLLLFRDDGTYVMRGALLVNPDKSMVYAGSVPQGSKVMFGTPPGEEITEYALDNLKEFQKKHEEADIVLMFSCMARHLALGPLIEDEVESVYHLFGKPMVGYFTYGEIGPNSLGKCDFHNDTLSMVFLKEKTYNE